MHDVITLFLSSYNTGMSRRRQGMTWPCV